MIRALVFLAFLYSLNFAHAGSGDPGLGTITSPIFSLKYGSAPGLDQFDLSGTFSQASGAPALNLPSDQVSLVFDNGHFTASLPSNSFTCNATTCTYTNSGASGITSFQIKPAAKTFSISVRKADFSATNSSRMGVISFSVGANVFSFRPNSPPVGVVTGPTSSTIGNLLTFDASNSTDFNSDPLTYAWTLISKPLGSTAALSSTGNPTTSITADLAGAYVLRAQPFDPFIGGTPGLITLNVTGGTAPTPPPPGPNNGLIVLASNLNSYVAGQTATLTLQVNVQDGNGARRYFYLPTWDDSPVALTTVTNNTLYQYVTPPLASGNHTFKIVQFSETTDIANDLNNAIANFNADILSVNKALQYETSPTLISQYQAQIAQDQAQIAIDQQQLVNNRSQIAGPAVLSVVAQ